MKTSPLRRILFFLIDAVHCWLIAASASALFQQVLEYPAGIDTVLFTSMALTPAILLFLRSKIFRRVILILLGAILLAGLIGFLLTRVSSTVNSFFASLLRILSEIDWPARLLALSSIGVVVLVNALSAIFVTFSRRTLYFCVLIPSAAFITLSIIGASFSVFPLAVFTLSCVFLIIRKKFDWFKGMVKSTGEIDRRGPGFPNTLLRSACLMAALLILCGAVTPLTVPEGPVFGEKFSKRIETFFEDMVNNSDFLRNLFGIEFNGKNTHTKGSFGKLGGPANLGNEPILMVKTDYPGTYLRGFTYNNYLGNAWNPDPVDRNAMQIGTGDPVPDAQITYMYPTNRTSVGLIHAQTERQLSPLFYNYNAYQHHYPSLALMLDNFMEEKTAVVQYMDPYDARFGFFIPHGTTSARFYDRDLHFYTQQLALNLQYTTGRSLVYTSDTPQAWSLYEATFGTITNELIDAFRLYDVCVPGYYKTVSGTVVFDKAAGFTSGAYAPVITGLSPTALSRYADNIRENYTLLPDSISSRVITLANDLTSGLRDDWHKAIAIKNYLLSGRYSYSLNPSPVPSGRDIVDWFLFDAPEGYCTYFATAMTVLARAAGIPARYCEGIYVDPKTATGNDVYVLTEKNLHAWSEIYMEGLGFVTMEATAGFSGQFSPRSDATPTPAPTVAPTPSPERSPSPSPEPTATTSDPSYTPSIQDPTPGPTEPAATPASLSEEARSAIKILIIVTIIIILIAGAVIAVLKLSVRKPGTSGDAGERIRAIYRKALSSLEMLGFKKAQTLTPREYAAFVKTGTGTGKKDVPEESSEAFEELTGMYEEAIYSEEALSEEDSARASECWNRFTKGIRDSRGAFYLRLLLIKTIGK